MNTNSSKKLKVCRPPPPPPFLNPKLMAWPCLSVEDRSPCVCDRVCAQGLVQSIPQGIKHFDIFIPMVFPASARMRQDSLPAACSSQQAPRAVLPVGDRSLPGVHPLSFELQLQLSPLCHTCKRRRQVFSSTQLAAFMKSMGLSLCLRGLSAHMGEGDMKALEKGYIHTGISASIPFP